jgi:hypothetical protein
LSRRSTSGNLMLYNQAPNMWRSKMQKTTALSTAGAEYYSASAVGSDVLYLRKLLEQLGFAQQSLRHQCTRTTCIEWGNTIIGGRERAKQIAFGGTSPTRSSRMVKCGLFGFRHRLSWRTSHDCTTRRAREQGGQFQDLRDPCPQEGMDRQG